MFKSLIYLYVSHDEFLSINNVLAECIEMKEEIKTPETSAEYTKWRKVNSYCVSCKKHAANENSIFIKSK